MDRPTPCSPVRVLVSAGHSCLTTLAMAWPVLAIGLAIADPPPVAVFAWLTDSKEMARPSE